MHRFGISSTLSKSSGSLTKASLRGASQSGLLSSDLLNGEINHSQGGNFTRRNLSFVGCKCLDSVLYIKFQIYPQG